MGLFKANLKVKKNSEDRRIFSRLETKLFLRYAKLGAERNYEAQTYDISAKGLSFFTNKRLACESRLNIWLKVPDEQEELFTRGWVMWRKRVGLFNYRVGIMLEKAELMGFSPLFRNRDVQAGCCS
jgi:hypothetical protein